MTSTPAAALEYRRDGLYYLDGRPFTGTAFTLANDGSPKCEATYRDGLLWGSTKERYRSGQPMVEAHFFMGVLHGRAREWHKSGQLAEDGEYEYGITIWEKHWDEHGDLTRDVVLTECEKDFATLLHYRRLYGGPDSTA